MKNLLLLSLTVLVFTGCSSRWNEKTCSETNFGDLGYQEGSAGKSSKMSFYNQACLKKGIQIPTSQYNNGLRKGLNVFCSPEKGRDDGASGSEVFANCRSIKAYAGAYRSGLKSFCNIEKGVQDGFAMKEELILCTSFDAYRKGFATGKKEFCSSDRGHENAFAGQEQDSRCVSYSNYRAGYAKGKKYFCSSKNAVKIGEKGDAFPKQCESAGRAFETAYNKGRKVFLEEVLVNKQTAVKFEKQNYERLRDDLQDAQFELGRLPKYSQNPDVVAEQAKVNQKIENLQNRRNKQRKVLEDFESQIYEIQRELKSL